MSSDMYANMAEYSDRLSEARENISLSRLNLGKLDIVIHPLFTLKLRRNSKRLDILEEHFSKLSANLEKARLRKRNAVCGNQKENSDETFKEALIDIADSTTDMQMFIQENPILDNGLTLRKVNIKKRPLSAILER